MPRRNHQPTAAWAARGRRARSPFPAARLASLQRRNGRSIAAPVTGCMIACDTQAATPPWRTRRSSTHSARSMRCSCSVCRPGRTRRVTSERPAVAAHGRRRARGSEALTRGRRASEWGDPVWKGRLRVVARGDDAIIQLTDPQGAGAGPAGWPRKRGPARSYSLCSPSPARPSFSPLPPGNPFAMCPVRQGGPKAVEPGAPLSRRSPRDCSPSPRRACPLPRAPPWMCVPPQSSTARDTSCCASRTDPVRAPLAAAARRALSPPARNAGKHAFIGAGFELRGDAFDFSVALSDHEKCGLPRSARRVNSLPAAAARPRSPGT